MRVEMRASTSYAGASSRPSSHPRRTRDAERSGDRRCGDHPERQRNHSLGQIVTALINAGLVIDELEETPRAAWCPWPELMEQDSTGGWHLREHPERLPLQFAITAHKN